MAGQSESKPTAQRTAQVILDAAEELFCARGFAGVSMRDIAAASGQPLASANYHFGSKAKLFEAVFLRRIVPVNQQRLALLRTFQAEGRTALADIVEAYLRPLFAEDPEEPEPGRKARLIMLFSKQLLSSPDEHQYLLDYYEEVSRAFIDGLHRALPHRPVREAVWGYNYLIGILVFTLAGRAPTARMPARLHRYMSPSEAHSATIERLKRFICAGLAALDQPS